MVINDPSLQKHRKLTRNCKFSRAGKTDKIDHYILEHSGNLTIYPNPGIRCRPASIFTLDPVKASPIGSTRPPRCFARNCSTMALKAKVLRRCSAMPLVRERDIGHRNPALLHGADDLLPLCRDHAHVVHALRDQQRANDAIDVASAASVPSAEALPSSVPGSARRRISRARSGFQ